MNSLDTLHALLTDNLALPSQYGPGFSNHLPMALQALQAMGADEARLRAWFAIYAQHFEGRREPQDAKPVDDWLTLRGRGDALPALRATFATRLQRESEDAVLHAVLPALLPGAAAALFHGLIRTAHAIESGHREELGVALACWAWRWAPPEAPAEVAGEAPLSVESWTAELLAQSAGWRSTAATIASRMQAARASAPFRALADRLAPTPGALAGLSAFAARRYAETGNFTVLHMVTACRAARVVLGRIAVPQSAIAPLACAFAAAYLSSGVGTEGSPLLTGPTGPSDWPDLLAQGCNADDEHVIKLVHACHDEMRAGRAGPYREAARRALA